MAVRQQSIGEEVSDQRAAITTYCCPQCRGALTLAYGSWECTDCGHVPNHGAD